MKTKIKSHCNEVTDFYKKEIPQIDFNHTSLEVTSFDSALKKDEKYYLQVFLKKCKYMNQKLIRHITQNIEIFPRDSDEE